jgi:hypothetical protein
MGADIHLVVEASYDADFRSPHGIALFHWTRRSALFAAMGLSSKHSLYPARGFPDPASSMALYSYGLNVVEDGDLDFLPETPSIWRSEAEEAIRSGSSRYLQGNKLFVSSPVYSDPSFLTLSEFTNALENSGLEPELVPIECELTMQMMAEIERRGLYSRMVFWFDR